MLGDGDFPDRWPPMRLRCGFEHPYGCMRIDERMAARRLDLLLPADSFGFSFVCVLFSCLSAFLMIPVLPWPASPEAVFISHSACLFPLLLGLVVLAPTLYTRFLFGRGDACLDGNGHGI